MFLYKNSIEQNKLGNPKWVLHFCKYINILYHKRGEEDIFSQCTCWDLKIKIWGEISIQGGGGYEWIILAYKRTVFKLLQNRFCVKFEEDWT